MNTPHHNSTLSAASAEDHHPFAHFSEGAFFAALDELCRIVDSAADSSTKLSRALESLSRTLRMTRGAITLLAPETQDIHIEIAYGLKPSEQSRGHYLPGEGITGMVIQNGRAMAVPDVAREPLFLNRTRARNLQKDRISFFCAPLKTEDRAIGALSVECANARPEFERPIMLVLTVAASLLAPHARRHQLGMVPDDSAKRTLQERLDEMERAAINDALERTSGHMGQAAASLGLTERIMALRMKKYGLRYQDYRIKQA